MPCDRVLFGIQPHHPQRAADGRQPGGEAVLGQEHLDAAVRDHPCQAIRRIAGVERQVGGAGREHAEDGDRDGERALEAERHEVARADASRQQIARQPIGPRPELAVGQALFAAADGDRRRPERRRRREALVERHGRRRRRRLTRVPPGEELVTLGRREDGQRRRRPFGVDRHGRQEDLQVPQHPLDAGVVEATVVRQPERQLLARHHRQRQRVVGPLGDGEIADRELAEPRRERRIERVVLERHQAVEQRHAGGDLAGGLDAGERRPFVEAQRELPLLHRRQPGGERLARRLEPHRHGVDEEPDDRLDSRKIRRPAGDDGAEDHVPAVGVAAEEESPGPLHDGARGHLEPLGQPLEGRRGRRP